MNHEKVLPAFNYNYPLQYKKKALTEVSASYTKPIINDGSLAYREH